MRANFNVINNTFSNDHAGLTQDPSIAGQHFQMTLRPQALDPTTGANQIAIYNKLVSSIPELFFRPQSNGTPIQMTYPSISTGLQSTNPDVYLPRQYSFMAGPFVIYGGFIDKSNVTQGNTITLSPNTTLLVVEINTANSEIPLFSNLGVVFNINAINISGNTFQLDLGGVGDKFFDIYYTAIGI